MENHQHTDIKSVYTCAMYPEVTGKKYPTFGMAKSALNIVTPEFNR